MEAFFLVFIVWWAIGGLIQLVIDIFLWSKNYKKNQREPESIQVILKNKSLYIYLFFIGPSGWFVATIMGMACLGLFIYQTMRKGEKKWKY